MLQVIIKSVSFIAVEGSEAEFESIIVKKISKISLEWWLVSPNL
jgi:hypothetical protein